MQGDPEPTEPSYLVERDGPEWKPPEPYDGRWQRKAVEFIRDRIIHDAYPDHETPFEDIRALPVPEPRAVAPPRQTGDIHLLVQGRTNCKTVRLAGASLDSIDLGKRLMQGWVLAAIHDTMLEVQAMDDENDKGQGLAEYALLLALISIIAIVALMALGGQIAAVFQQIADQIPGNTPAP